MGTMPLTNEIDLVDPTLSPRRQWLCRQLALLLPNNVVTLASNDPKTSAFFKDWTGQTQKNLEEHWKLEGFTRSANPAKEGVWTRAGIGAVTTSCEGLIGQSIIKLEAAGFGKAIRGKMSSFNLPGCATPSGQEPAQTTVGWHWWRDRTEALHPQPGDFFQIGTPVAPGRWTFAHVGVITGWADERNPVWTTVEAGQAGPSAGYDFMKRKGPRQMNPVDPRHPKKQLMGWLNLDEFFGDKS